MVNRPVPVASRRGAILLRTLALAGVAVALSGCYTPRNSVDIPSDYRKRHPITIKEGERTVELFVGSNRGSLTAAQRAEVLAFAQAWRRESTGGILIEVPAGTDNNPAARDAMREIRSMLAASGVPTYGVNVRPYEPKDSAKLTTIRLNYSRMVAEAGPCGLWPHDLGPAADPAYAENRPYWNLGCATQRNLAAMVENPADLVQPRGDAGSNSQRRSVVLEKYRKGENPAGVYPDNSAAKLSGLGK
jgi:pilus assembly protein CpaD